MNYFYAPPQQWKDDKYVVIKNQEATHIIKVLRHKLEDVIFVANGQGVIFECRIEQISRNEVRAVVLSKNEIEKPRFDKVLGFGIIKVRDRLEFAIEKAVELGATEIVLFNADNTQRTKVNVERLELLITSAFKQSGRYWMPKLKVLTSLDEIYNQYKKHTFILAYEKTSVDYKPQLTQNDIVLLVGPEGGFSDREVEIHKKNEGIFVSLGKNRLRAETAVTALLSQYLFMG